MTQVPAFPPSNSRPHRPRGPATGEGRAPARGRSHSPRAAGACGHQKSNDELLQAYAVCRRQGERLKLRNRLVMANLPLVRAVASRQGAAIALPYEDRVQLGCMGLIRALEGFRPQHGCRFSSYAVPYVLGAMRREWRDRGQTVRIPRTLWDLAERVHRLQERRRTAGLGPMADSAVAALLGEQPERIREALAAQPRCRCLSLDMPAPAVGDGHDGDGGPRLERLADPRSLGDAEEQRNEAVSARASALWRLIELLPPEQGRLLIGRHLHGCSWVELGTQLGITARRAQRLGTRLVADLRRQAMDPG